jgi:hypothetical protein
MKKWELFEYAAGYRARLAAIRIQGSHITVGVVAGKTPIQKLPELDRHNASWPRAGTMITQTQQREPTKDPGDKRPPASTNDILASLRESDLLRAIIRKSFPWSMH